MSRRPGEQVGHHSQLSRPWPANPETPGFITKRGKTVHWTEECRHYQQGVRNSRKFGRTVHPIEWTTTGDARRREKAPCTCWEGSSVRMEHETL